jgi:hypothetical protein
MADLAIWSKPFVWAFVVLIALTLLRLLQVGKRDLRLPPGPPTIPILGNAHQIPRTGLYKQYVISSLVDTGINVDRLV